MHKFWIINYKRYYIFRHRSDMNTSETPAAGVNNKRPRGEPECGYQNLQWHDDVLVEFERLSKRGWYDRDRIHSKAFEELVCLQVHVTAICLRDLLDLKKKPTYVDD